MLAKVFSAATIGLDGVLIEVEVDVASRGLPTFTIVGLPTKAVDEAKDRVRTAIVNASFEMPDSRITVNLAPADLPKEGSSFDLPIAVGILAASGAIKKESLVKSLFVGELSLEGYLRRVPGVISLALLASQKKLKSTYVPTENAEEASIVENLNVFAISTLTQLILHLNEHKILEPHPKKSLDKLGLHCQYEFDFSEIKGQEQAKRALEIAACGFHNVHLRGVPGAGKTMLSRAFPSILPPLEKDEILEVSKIHSVSNVLSKDNFVFNRPFRSPHHTVSRNGLIGGGTNPKPGEISLAHRGVLFLDEFSEFPRSVLEALRQPLEDGTVTISRASMTLSFPCRFLLVAASNPCPCGYLGHPKKACRCSLGAILKYKKRLSGPILDRIDLHVDVPAVEENKLTQNILAENSVKIQARVVIAKQRQKIRFKNSSVKTNGEMSNSDIKNFCQIEDDALELLKQAVSRLSLSARSYFKLIKIGQTIADLAGEEKIKSSYIAEALQYRVLED